MMLKCVLKEWMQMQEKVLDELKASVASPARKREMLMMEMLDMLEK